MGESWEMEWPDAGSARRPKSDFFQKCWGGSGEAPRASGGVPVPLGVPPVPSWGPWGPIGPMGGAPPLMGPYGALCGPMWALGALCGA